MRRGRLLYGILEGTGGRTKIIWEAATKAKLQKVILVISIRFNQEGGLRADVCFKPRFKRLIFPRTLERLLLSAIMELYMYGIRLAKIPEIFWRIVQLPNLEPILLGVIVYMQRYHRIADICARQDQTGRRSFSTLQHGNSHTIYRRIRNGCGMVSTERMFISARFLIIKPQEEYFEIVHYFEMLEKASRDIVSLPLCLLIFSISSCFLRRLELSGHSF